MAAWLEDLSTDLEAAWEAHVVERAFAPHQSERLGRERECLHVAVDCVDASIDLLAPRPLPHLAHERGVKVQAHDASAGLPREQGRGGAGSAREIEDERTGRQVGHHGQRSECRGHVPRCLARQTGVNLEEDLPVAGIVGVDDRALPLYPANSKAGTPFAPGRARKRPPASGCAASCASERPLRAVVM